MTTLRVSPVAPGANFWQNDSRAPYITLEAEHLPKRPATESRRVLEREDARARKEWRHPGPVPPYARPQTRADCSSFARPCPFVGCRYNLSLDVTPSGGIRYAMGTNWDDLIGGASNCALDRACEGMHARQQIADVYGVGREAIRQEEEEALAKLKAWGVQR